MASYAAVSQDPNTVEVQIQQPSQTQEDSDRGGEGEEEGQIRNQTNKDGDDPAAPPRPDSQSCCGRLSRRMKFLLLVSSVLLLLLATQAVAHRRTLEWALKSGDEEEEWDNSQPGPETCGQDRDVLAQWFMDHGSPNLVLPPKPPLFEPVIEDPYDDPNNPPLQPDEITGFCGMQWADTVDEDTGLLQYHLANFTTEDELFAAGYEVTHAGHCGACSSLQDLGVYESQNLTDPTTICGIKGLFDEKEGWNCLMDLGFSEMCATIWWWNVLNSSEECGLVCFIAWLAQVPNNLEDGSLNKCLQCDEDKSGPNFQYFAGRTRRNSGIPSSIDRPDEEIYDVEHCYYYGLDHSTAPPGEATTTDSAHSFKAPVALLVSSLAVISHQLYA